MADPFVYSDRTGTAITGTSSQTLLGAALTIPEASLEEETEFQGTFVGRYHNDTGTRRDVVLDLVANGNVIHRSSLSSIAHNVSFDRTITADYNLIVTESNTAMVICRANVSAASSTTGQDLRSTTTTTTGQTFDITADVTLDLKATLSTISDIDDHSLTPLFFRMNTLGSFTVISGGGGGSLDEVPDEFPEAWVWTGSEYEQPTGGFFPRVRFFVGPVEPNGINSPALLGYYVHEDTSGA